MTQEDKELLLKDLSARLPYGVMLRIAGHDVNLTTYNTWIYFGTTDEAREYIKPYLRPMSSMTKEEWAEYDSLSEACKESGYYDVIVDWLNSHHLDYRHLIEKGLALEAPKDMYVL